MPPTTATRAATDIVTMATGLSSKRRPLRENPNRSEAVPIKKPQSEAKLK